ncbi:hypothetical protein [Flammeovirga sp. SJP92]|uniref:hypothetical protein n=1 Tax=Flammeovirga sp. SJP92 TaxID=1775430 RepID=UPI000787BE6E|nr:hypothetical protein [Flammeovirga sp. SJP92]KXX70744.1 hypothetical protein AVL50_07980 [Flammeovirga sp. SJP92]
MRLFLLPLLLLIYNVSWSQKTEITLSISSSDLSEDFSILSSKNDELLFLVYEDKDDVLDNPVLMKEFNFDSTQMDISFFHQLDLSKSYVYFLIELDSRRNHLQIDPIIRLHYKKIAHCFRESDYLCVEEYLEDEDVLGIGTFKIPTANEIEGVYKIDSYKYKIKVDTFFD